MPLAASRRSKAAKKTKEQTALTPARKDSMMADESQGATPTTVEASRVAINDNSPDPSQGGIMAPSEYYIGDVGKKTFQSMGAIFGYWADQPMEEDSVYNAADRENPFHADWLKYQEAFQKKDKAYTPAFVPSNLELAKANGIDISSNAGLSGSKISRAKNCSYWPLGTCRNGDDCRFYHDPAKTPKPSVALSNMRWR